MFNRIPVAASRVREVEWLEGLGRAALKDVLRDVLVGAAQVGTKSCHRNYLERRRKRLEDAWRRDFYLQNMWGKGLKTLSFRRLVGDLDAALKHRHGELGRRHAREPEPHTSARNKGHMLQF